MWLAKGGTWSDDVISVWALGSTDSGVSWIVETEDKAAIKREQSRTCSNYAESRERKSGAQSSWRMKEFTDEKDITFWEINREGETIEI